jgi:hypothetical protein
LWLSGSETAARNRARQEWFGDDRRRESQVVFPSEDPDSNQKVLKVAMNWRSMFFVSHPFRGRASRPFFFVALALAGGSLAQQTPSAVSGAAAVAPGGSSVAVPTASNKPVDLTLAPEAHCRDAQGQAKKCELGDTVFVAFTNLREWMADLDNNKPKDLVLVLNGRVMKGLTPRGPDTQYKELAFDLARLDSGQVDSKENRDAWGALLSRSKWSLAVSAGVALGGNPPYFGPATVTFQVFPSYSWLVIVFLLALLILLLLLAQKSDILRDGPSATGAPKLSFSLARCQMAWWFFVIVAAFNYIWMVVGDSDSVTPGALMLLGISAATGLGGVVVDSSKRDQRQSLQNEKAALTAGLTALEALMAVPAPANLYDLQAEHQQKTARLAEVDTALHNLPTPPGPSEGFLLDILRDETGVTFHRFQMAAWTVVLGFVFVISVYRNLAMPDFSATLLGLMGISAGTYIGFKIPDPPK